MFSLLLQLSFDGSMFLWLYPEYAMHGEFSVKIDVYSFGVLLMEIISGKKNSCFYKMQGATDLLSYVSIYIKHYTLSSFIQTNHLLSVTNI